MNKITISMFPNLGHSVESKLHEAWDLVSRVARAWHKVDTQKNMLNE